MKGERKTKRKNKNRGRDRGRLIIFLECGLGKEKQN